MKDITKTEEFQQLISSEKPVVIKFYAGWCPDCVRMDMFIPEIIEKHTDYEWYQMNRDDFPELADKYAVMGIPSLLVFKNGEKVAHLHSANAKTPESVESFLAETGV
ncbi:thioredoxin family protein [Litoribacterium kuwaitense]|uniref:thioredoxin family protein n=1 Tax=Litoribacterium kuwaitense TaxID=1398745 RepID=UPI001FE2D2AA|nr:thioredoxin family protein [Litoribacterium kuwaitense]